MILLGTVMHSGTTYFHVKLKEEHRKLTKALHCTWSLVNRLDDYEWVATTWRDPWRVAASWANRGHLSPRWDLEWCTQWSAYRALREWGEKNPDKFKLFDFKKGPLQHGYDFGEEPKNVGGDHFLLHDALDRHDLEFFFNVVPRTYIEHALNETRHLKNG